MGARQSKRSVDITTTPKKDGAPSDGSVAGDAAAPGDGKLERIEETDGKPTTNGTAPHADPVIDEKDKDKEQQETGKDKDKDEDTEKDEEKLEDTKSESKTDSSVLTEEATTPTEAPSPTSPDGATSPDGKDTKKKEKKKWSFRSLSFGKRDRSKTAREGTPKNGDVAKVEPLTEGGEEAEAAVPVEETTGEKKAEEAVASSPAEESTPAAAVAATEVAASVPEVAAPASVKEEEETVVPVESPPVVVVACPIVETSVVTKSSEEAETTEKEEEEPACSPPVVPVVNEEKKEPELVVEKVETIVVGAATAVVSAAGGAAVFVADNIVEVSQSQAVTHKSSSSPSSSSSSIENRVTVEAALGCCQAQTEATNIAEREVRDNANEKSSSSSSSSPSSVVERKTSEEIPPPLPSSPPPTPIDPSPLERAQHAAASPSALAEALKAPAEAANSAVVPPFASDMVVDGFATTISPSDVEVIAETETETEKVDQRSSSSRHSDSNSCPREKENEGVKEVKEDSSKAECDAVSEVASDHLNGNFVDQEIMASSVVGESPKEVTPLPVEEEKEKEKEKEKEEEEEESLVVVVEAKPAFVVSEDVERSIVSDKVRDEEEIVPPLPESPIPSLERSSLLQDTESEAVFDPIEELRASHMASEGIAGFKESVAASPIALVEGKNPSFEHPLLVPQREINAAVDKGEEVIPVFPLSEIKVLDSDPQNLKTDPDACSLIVKPVAETEIVVTNGGGGGGNKSFPSCQIPSKVDKIIIDTSLEFQDLVYETKSKSIVTTVEDCVENKSNDEFEVESLTLSLNSYNDSESKFKERLAESEETNGDDENAQSSPIDFSMPLTAPSTNDLPANDLQKITEPEAPAENPAEISTTESVTEIPSSPAPPAPMEIPVLPLSEPAITEDVASVTKAIEEIDISDKAVAAAVNEAIESINTNEIINDSLHQNIIKE